MKSLLEQFVQSSQLQVQGQVGQSLQGTLGESQGSALLSQSEVRIGIPPGLDQASGVRPDEGPLRQPEGAWGTLSVFRAVLEGFWMLLLAV